MENDAQKARRLHLLSALCKTPELSSSSNGADCFKQVDLLAHKTFEEQAIVFTDGLAETLTDERQRDIFSLEKLFGVRILQPNSNAPFFVVEGKTEGVDRTVSAIEGMFKKKPMHAADVGHDNGVHVFVDNSNIMIGARNFHGGRGRLNVPALTKLIEQDRHCLTRIVVGSSKSESSGKFGIWKKWRDCGYFVRLGVKDGQQREVFVDDALHASMAKVILNPEFEQRGQNIILLSGDGNSNKGGNSFPLLLEASIRRGFNVEIWCWENSCSRVLKKLAEQGGIKLVFLNLYLETIIFRKPNRDNHECVVCLERVADVVLRPCRHKVLCHHCFQLGKIETCPICRSLLE